FLRLAFWKKPDPSIIENMSWNLMVAALNPDKCWELASQYRKTGLPGSVLTCETSFLLGSVVRDIIRDAVPPALLQKCIATAESAYFKTFDDQSDSPLPAE